MSRVFTKEHKKRSRLSRFKKNWNQRPLIVRRAYARLNRELDLLIEIDDMKDILAEKRPGGAEYSQPGLAEKPQVRDE